MSSILRIASSRANGAKSHGPVTPEGKARSSAYLSVLEDELQPAPGFEASLVETMAVAHWRRIAHPESLQNGETPVTQLALAAIKNHQMDKRKHRQQSAEKIEAKAAARAKTVQISKPTEPNLGEIR